MLGEPAQCGEEVERDGMPAVPGFTLPQAGSEPGSPAPRMRFAMGGKRSPPSPGSVFQRFIPGCPHHQLVDWPDPW